MTSPQSGLDHHQEDDDEHEHHQHEADDGASLGESLVLGAVGASRLEGCDLLPQRRGVEDKADGDQHEPQNERPADPKGGEGEAADEHVEQPGEEQETIGRIGEAVIEGLDAAQDVAEV